MKIQASSILAFLASVNALDMQLKSFTCDQDLPFTALGISMTCQEGATERCTFGETATFNGKLQYNNTEAAGVDEGGVVYGKAELQLLTLDYNIFNNIPLYMCGPWVQAIEQNENVAYEKSNGGRKLADAEEAEDAEDAEDAEEEAAEEEAANDDAAVAQNGNGCAADGTYAFYVDLDLPVNDNLSWLQTGWKGIGDVMLFAESGDSTSIVGYCTLEFATFVTPQDDLEYGKYIPSSMIAAIALGAFIFSVTLCCMCRKKKDTATATAAPSRSVAPKKEKLLEQPAAKGGDYVDPIEASRSASGNLA